MKNSETEENVYSKEYAEFITVTCLEWKPVLHEDRFKDVIIDSLSFLTKSKRVTVYAFVIMSNHFHLIWQMVGDHKREDVQRDFLKFTAKELLHLIKSKKGSQGLEELFVGLKDRTYQVWKRNSMSIDLIHDWFFNQKFEYLHRNPCQPHWQLALLPEDYRYSSAHFYEFGNDEFGFLTHYSEI